MHDLQESSIFTAAHFTLWPRLASSSIVSRHYAVKNDRKCPRQGRIQKAGGISLSSDIYKTFWGLVDSR